MKTEKQSLGEEITVENDNLTIVVSIKKYRENSEDEFHHDITLLDNDENEFYNATELDDADVKVTLDYLKDMRDKINIVLNHFEPVKKKKK